MSSGTAEISEKAAVLEGEGTVQTRDPGQILKAYFLERSPVFRRLTELKQKGWNNPAGDAHFNNRKKSADTANEAAQRKLFHMMIQIGDELNDATDAFSHPLASENIEDNEPINVLDICMAPGGFTASILKHHPSARVSGLSLPLENGGHKMRVRRRGRDQPVNIKYLDITMLIADLYPSPGASLSTTPQEGSQVIPISHPRAHLLIPNTRPYFTTPPIFGLAVCDGQVLRTHNPPLPEKGSEATRLDCAQLIIALTRLRNGGTLIMLRHRPDAWNTARLIQTVDSFSTGPVRLFKSAKKHADRSSFYLVAKGVQPDHPAAKEAVEMWRRTWLAATLRSGENSDQGEDGGNTTREWSDWEKGRDAHAFVRDFGDRLIELAEPIWEIQADALEKAPYIMN